MHSRPSACSTASGLLCMRPLTANHEPITMLVFPVSRAQSKFSGEERFHASPLICCDRFESIAAKSLSVRRQNSSALQGRWPAGPEGFPTHVSFRMANKTAIMAAARETKGHYDPPHGEQNGHYGRVGVRPPPPLRGSSPCEAGQSWHPHGEQKRRYVPAQNLLNPH